MSRERALLAAPSSTSRFAGVKAPRGAAGGSRAAGLASKSVSDHLVLRVPFHTWDEDDQSVASGKEDLKKDSVKPVQPRAVELRGLSEMETDSDDEAPSTAADDKDSDPEADIKEGNSLQKTLLPMLSEEEIHAKEHQFRDLVQRSRATLRATVFAFADNLNEPVQPAYAPLSPPPSPKIDRHRSKQLAKALDEVVLLDSERAPRSSELTSIELPTSHTLPVALCSPKTSRTQQLVEGDVEPEVNAVQRTRRRAPALAPASELPTLLTEKIADEVSFLNIKITKTKAREFDWAQRATVGLTPLPTTTAESTTAIGQEAPPALATLPRSADADDAISVTVFTSEMHFPPAKAGSIGFDSRGLEQLSSDADPAAPRPVTQFSNSSSNPTLAERAHVSMPSARTLPVRATGPPADPVGLSLRAFTVSKAAQSRMLAGHEGVPVPPLMLESEVLKLSAKPQPSPRAVDPTAYFLRSHSQSLISQCTDVPALRKERSAQSMNV